MKRTIVLVAALAILGGCASVAAPQLRNVSIETDISSQVSGDFDYWSDGAGYGGARVGRVAIALDQPLTSSVTYRLGIEHRSMLDTNHDRGEERAYVGLKWRPFAHDTGR